MHDFRYSLLDYNDAAKIDDVFLTNLYIYFRYGGYNNIIVDNSINIMISVFLMLFIKFIYSCINFHGLFTNTGEHAINEFINWGKFSHFDAFMCISFIVFLIYIAFRSVTTYQNIKKFKKTKEFYNKTLKINDTDIQNYNWEKIIDKLVGKSQNTSNMNVYTVTSRIMKMDNIFISLFDKKIMPFTYLNSLVEWNIRHCFLHSLQSEENDESFTKTQNQTKYKEEVKRRLFRAAILNLIFLPFILLFIGFYTIIQYGEAFYNAPSLITSRTWTLTSKWRFRFYNELPHIFEHRMELASEEMKNYFAQFNYRILEIVSRFIVFVISSIFLLLIFIVFVNENNLTNKGFFGFQPLLWYITICATILAIFRKFTKKNLVTHPKESLDEANQHLKLISETNIKHANSPSVRNKMATYYQYHLVCLVREVLSIVITPFYYMPKLYEYCDEICEFILESLEVPSENRRIMGDVSKFSIFTKYTMDVINENPKLKYSIESFKENHTNWNITSFDMVTTLHPDDKLELPKSSIYETIVVIEDSSEDETF